MKRLFDFVGYTLTLVFLAAFGYAITFKVFDTFGSGETTSDLHIPLWFGYTFAAMGILAAVLMALIRWYQVVIQRR